MQDSLKKRYAIKYICTFAVVAVNAAVQILLPRALSVDAFADYSYNLNVFTAVLAIAILSMDGAFASKVSKRLNETGLIKFYGKFLLLITVILNLLIWIVFITGYSKRFFTGQSFTIVILALNAAITLKITQEFISLFDCYALTRISDPVVVAEKILIGIVVYAIFLAFTLKLSTYYIIQITAGVLVCMLLAYIFLRKNKALFEKNESHSTRDYMTEFYIYCRPLVLITITGNVIQILSNVILKNYGGNTEQAYYGVAWQLNNLIVYTFTPITALLQREFSVRIKSREDLRNFYKKSLLITMGVVSFFSCYVISDAERILQTLFGDVYTGAALVTRLIMIFTIFQAWGQVKGNMFMASERTATYAKINIAIQIISFALLFLFQVPNFIWPEGLGSTGIGLQKMTANIISVMLSMYFNCKYLALKYHEEAAPSAILAIVLVLDSFICVLITHRIGGFPGIVISGLMYTVIAGCQLLIVMKKNGMSPGQLIEMIKKR